MPDQVKVELRGWGTESPRICVGEMVMQGELTGEWNEGVVWRYYLKRGMDWKHLEFEFPEGKGNGDVAMVFLQKWKIWVWGKSGAGLVCNASGRWAFQEHNFECMGIVPGKTRLGLMALELALLGCCFLLARKNECPHWRENGWMAFGVALALTSLIGVVLPLQVYWGNQSAFQFEIAELMVALGTRWIVALGMTTVGLWLLTMCFGRWLFGVVFAFAVCVYLESGVLSQGLPDLNGDWWFFENKSRALWDGAAWVGVFGLIAALHRALKKRYGIAAWCLTGLAVASLLDVQPEKQAQTDTSRLFVHKFASRELIARSVKYATTNNVFVFILDSLEREQAHDVMCDPEVGDRLKLKFQGFTEYTDNVGAGHVSASGVANLLTGKYPETVEGLADFFASPYSGDSVLKAYWDAGFGVHVMTEGPGFGDGIDNRMKEETPAKQDGPVLARPIAGGQAWTLPDITQFRWIPFGIKGWYLRLCSLKLAPQASRPDYTREEVLYPVLAGAEIDEKEKGAFLLIHTEGVHVPILQDRHGVRLPSENNTEVGCREMGVFVLGELGRLFDAYRAKGIYDSALILVLADHGHHGPFPTDREDVLPGNARPFLWVKPVGSQHAFTESRKPTSHSRIHGVLRDSVECVLTEGEIQDLLESDSRVYRKVAVLGGEWEDWVIEKDGTFSTERGVGGTSVESLTPIEVGREYSLEKKNRETLRHFFWFKNMETWGFPVIFSHVRDVSLCFKVSDVDRRYALHMRLKMKRWGSREDTQGAVIKFRQDGKDNEWTEYEAEYHVDVVLGNLLPDEHGLITIEIERGEGLHSYVFFETLTVDLAS